MAEIPGRDVSISGMTEPEAREFHSIFVTSFIIFAAVAIVAHILVYLWRPWLPGPNGYKTSLEGAQHFASLLAHAFSLEI